MVVNREEFAMSLKKQFLIYCLTDETNWGNDRDADEYTPSHSGNCENSVIV